MKQFLLYIALLGSISGIRSACTNPNLTRQIVIDNLCTLTACSLELTTQLNDLNSTLTSCCADVQQNFNGTFTVISDIKDTLTICCASLKESLTSLSATVTADLTPIFTTINALKLCDATPITTSTTISTSGTYCLANDITGQVYISANNVVFDLNGHEISGDTNGVQVFSNVSCVVIKNGCVRNTTLHGVIAHSGCGQITIENIEAINCGTSNNSNSWGILLDRCDNCIVRNCAISNGFQGISLSSTNNTLLANCFVLSCTQSTVSPALGFNLVGENIEVVGSSVIDFQNTTNEAIGWLSTGSNHVISECAATNITAAGTASGYQLIDITNAAIQNFTVQGVSATGSAVVGAGFYFFTTPSRNCSLKGCIAQNISGTDSAYGYLVFPGLGTPCNSCAFLQCTAMNVDNGSGSTGSYGFCAPLTENSLFYQCLATNITGATTIVGISDNLSGLYGNYNLFVECFAADISGTGFSSASSTSQFINNTASGNTTNYSGVSNTVPRGNNATVGNNVSA